MKMTAPYGNAPGEETFLESIFSCRGDGRSSRRIRVNHRNMLLYDDHSVSELLGMCVDRTRGQAHAYRILTLFKARNSFGQTNVLKSPGRITGNVAAAEVRIGSAEWQLSMIPGRPDRTASEESLIGAACAPPGRIPYYFVLVALQGPLLPICPA
jgi:hypothetical protein